MNDPARFQCTACSTKRPLVCNGGMEDDEIVNTNGQCIDPFRKMFDVTLAIAQRYYLEYGTGFSDTQLPVIAFTTGFTQEKGTRNPYQVIFVSGETDHDSSVTTLSQVRLIFCVRKFDWPTYMATFYVLMHECVPVTHLKA